MGRSVRYVCDFKSEILFSTIFLQYAIAFLHVYLNMILLFAYYFWVQARPIYAQPQTHSQFLRLLLVHQRLESLFELLNSHLPPIPRL